MTTLQDVADIPQSIELPPPGKGLFRYSVGLVIAIFFLMKMGAMVTSTNSGMVYTTWPDADGYWLWPEGAGIDGALEHGHRLLGWLVGLLSIGLVVWVKLRDRRPIMFRLALGLLALVIVQGVLGGLRVLENQDFPFLFAVIHGMLAQVVLCLACFLAYCTSNAWVTRSVEDAGQVGMMRKLSLFALAMVFVQIFLGVVFRHMENIPAKWIHVGFALFVSLAILISIGYCMKRFAKIPGFTRMNRIGLTLLGLQIMLGFATLIVRRPKEYADTESLGRAIVQSLHVMFGASLFVLATILVARAYRNLVPRRAG